MTAFGYQRCFFFYSIHTSHVDSRLCVLHYQMYPRVPWTSVLLIWKCNYLNFHKSQVIISSFVVTFCYKIPQKEICIIFIFIELQKRSLHLNYSIKRYNLPLPYTICTQPLLFSNIDELKQKGFFFIAFSVPFCIFIVISLSYVALFYYILNFKPKTKMIVTLPI